MGIFGDKFTILFVCKANITRSAYLNGYVKHYLREHMPYAQKKVRILSAGIQARTGASASRVVQHVAQRNGFSLARHLSSPLTRKMVKSANVILVMEKGQKEAIDNYFPEVRDKTFRLTEYLRTDHHDYIGDIPDPTGLDAAEYRAFLDVAHAEVDRIFRELSREDVL